MENWSFLSNPRRKYGQLPKIDPYFILAVIFLVILLILNKKY